jgi:hypothetical protein
MSFELPFSAAARQWRVFKVVGRSAVISNVPLSRMCRYLECAVISNVPFIRVPFFQKFTVLSNLPKYYFHTLFLL